VLGVVGKGSPGKKIIKPGTGYVTEYVTFGVGFPNSIKADSSQVELVKIDFKLTTTYNLESTMPLSGTSSSNAVKRDIENIFVTGFEKRRKPRKHYVRPSPLTVI